MDSRQTFRALIVEEKNGRYTRKIGMKSISDLPPGDVIIKVRYSSLNYKDALSAIGNKGITRNYPHTPGIDAAGTIVESKVPQFTLNQQVLVTGFDLGMNTPGGFGEYIRVPADWVVPLPKGLTLEQAMMFGTAGLTAGMGVFKLQQGGVLPSNGPVLVTGATGGVGSLSVAILAHLGYETIAVSGKPDAADWLDKLGAARILARKALATDNLKPLLPKQWAGAIDTVGGPILATVLRSTNRHGIVACCGNVASPKLELTVYPFILRGISLMGIDSATSPMELRLKVWENLAGPWKPGRLSEMVQKIDLDQLNSTIELMLNSKHKGRFVVSLEQ